MYIDCVVTLHREEDLENFYKEMENGSLLGRSIKYKLKRPLSRNTHYSITKDEIKILQKDPRVIEVFPESIFNYVFPSWTQNGVWSKSTSTDNLATYDNWGLYRCVKESNVTGWGSDNESLLNIIDSLRITGTGKNVDIIIDDGHINPAHPEMAINPDGTGGSRVIQLDWHTLTPIAQSLDDDSAFSLVSPYVYTPYTGGSQESNNNHGVHVGGTAAGNTQGWARDANIYNISPYMNTPTNLIKWDYIRAFHRTKAVNSTTGIKNPTIVNCSYTFGLYFPSAFFNTGPITAVNYRGTLYTAPPGGFSTVTLQSYRIKNSGGATLLRPYYTGIVADIESAISDGIIVVAAAGNDTNYYMDTPGGIDYDNYFVATVDDIEYNWYYNRGAPPGATPNAICVGAVSSLQDEKKADYSNTGPRIDIWAPGTHIQSSLHTGGVLDPRAATFRLGKYDGTSMASPQVTGILACLLEIYPRMTPAQAKEWIVTTAKSNKITNGSGNYDLLGAPNKFLYYDQQRKQEGQLTPFDRNGLRKTTGQIYPRPKIFRYG